MKTISSLSIRNEVSNCLMCYDAPCSKVCPNVDVAKGIRSYFLGNGLSAARVLKEANCLLCEKRPCLKACTRARVARPVDIPSIVSYAHQDILKYNANGVDYTSIPSLSIDFCGFECENPFILGSSIIANNYDMCANALKAGWAGVCVKTVSFSDVEEVSPRFDVSSKVGGHFAGFKNLEIVSEKSLEENMKWIKRLKQDFPSKLIMVSIMGDNEKEWEDLARISSENGADIIECNFSCPQMLNEHMGSDVGANNELVERYCAACRRGTSKPILAKLTPNLTNSYGFVEAALRGGADGIAGINTVKSIATVDFKHSRNMGNQGKGAVSGYSGRAVKPIALRFVKEVSERSSVISGIGGIYTWRDALDFILLGSSNLQVCTAVMEYGYRIIDDLVEGLSIYMQENGYSSLKELVGKAKEDFVNPADLNRSIKVIPVIDRDMCIGCGRCYISCLDGGHQAIDFSKSRKPIIGENCVGCHLCKLVCPVNAIK